MTPTYTKHEKISLQKHPVLNERWLHDRIAEDPSILGLGDVRLLDQERSLPGGGRIDLILLNDESGRRYEVEIQLGATDPSHIIRCIEYWDIERRRFPGYDHVAVIVAENITTRFLNVMGLLAGSIPIIAIQLNALQLGEHLLLDFTQVLDQAELRVDDTETDSGGGQADRNYWNDKAGAELMKICDGTLDVINKSASVPCSLSYLRGYIGLQANGVVNNFIHFAPKRTKGFVHIMFRHSDAPKWVERFEKDGVPVVSRRKDRFKLTVTPSQFRQHAALIAEAIGESVSEFES